MSTYTAPSGFSFTLRLPAAVPERLRRPVAQKLVELAKAFEPVSDGTSDQKEDAGWELSPDDVARADELNDLLAVALLVNWSLEVPISREAMLDLPAGDYTAIRKAVAPHATTMLPDFSPTPESGTPTTP